MRGFLRVLGVVTCAVLLPTIVFAQGGTIAGVVKDTSGAVLPGVTVEVASPALIERVRSAVTDGSGQYRIVDLRPGTYTVTAALTGFNTFKRDGIEISGIAVVTINADMKVGAIEETVTVSGETPVVDLQSTTKERVMSKDVIDALPTGRMYNSLGVLVPGVNSSQRDVGGALGDTMASLTAHGGSGGDQRILQNGLNVMTLQTGGGNIGGSVPNTAAAQEVAIDTSSASAERQTGGVSVNFIPRDGGNTIRGSVFATGATEGQQSNNFTQSLVDEGLTNANKFKTNWDVNPGIGGPIMKDKLWYYYTYRNNGAYNYAAGMFYNQNEFLANNYVYVPANGLNGAGERPALSNHANWWDNQLRLTWQVNAKNKIAATWDQQYKCECARTISSTRAPEAGIEYRFPVQRLMHAEWWSPLTSKVLLEVVALHRTERWGNMELKQGTNAGSQHLTPAQFALYPSMIGVTQTNGTIPGLEFHGPAGTFNNNWVPNYTYRWAVSYITGSHAFKVGGQDSFGFLASTVFIPTLDPGSVMQGGLQRPVRYRFASQNTPDQVTFFQTPYTSKSDENHDLGLFAQDRWTMNRLTLNLGIRFDYFNSSVPAQTLLPSTMGRPQTDFAALDNLNWKDVTPRFGMSYDLQGDGRTAIKVSLNKYVAGQALGGLGGNANPIGRLTSNQSRTWNDSFFGVGDPRTGNFIVDCDLNNRTANGECTNNGTAVSAYQLAAGCSAALGAVGCVVPNPLTDTDIRSGWNTRGYNWEFSAGVQREIMPRVSVDVSYFRRWFGNFTAVDQQQLAVTDFDSFDVTTPTDSRLPGGGAQKITGFVDPKTNALAAAGALNKTVLTDSIGANQIDHWNGVDVTVNARLQNGLLLQGGTGTGRRYTNNCEVSALLPETLGTSPQSFCEVTEPFVTQVKFVAAYTLPRYAALPGSVAQVLQNIQIAGTFQSIPGAFKTATYVMPNAEFSSLALSSLLTVNPLHGDGIADTNGDLIPDVNISNANNKNLNLIAPGSVLDERQNQLDLRLGRIFRIGRTRTSVNFDVFNLTNANTVLTRNNAFSKTPGNGVNNAVNNLWAPATILQARFYKISATFDF
ncbi:MAG: carboxypeptidase regulatory-like domain-containing protein [Vicinamibacterales bacterium]